MPAKPVKRLSQLIDAALALPPEQRMAFIESLGEEHEELKPRLRTLINHSLAPERQEQLATLPKVEPEQQLDPDQHPNQRVEVARFDSSALVAGATFGAYELVRRLGIGAMGDVWLARTVGESPPREVALKFAHMAARRADLLVRLAREQRLLAALDHPNIARIYDAGVSPHGQPYLVLEYVEGLVLDAYCAAERPSLERRLMLFLQVANAVAHAHERMIVHRDLKPANVLVRADGHARLLDFGIGKLLSDGLPTGLALSAITGQPLTPAYASPEQLRGEAAGFASDIYALGVMLFELLTGVRPYVYTLGSTRGLREAVLDRQPPAPSAEVADRALQRSLQRGLDAIVVRALDKKPEQRHPNANALAEDVARALAELD